MKNKKVLWGALFGLAALVLVTNMNVLSSLAMSIVAGGTNDNLYLNPTGNGRVVIGGDSIVVASKSADPTTNRTGQIYFNTGSKEVRVYDGTLWRSLVFKPANTHSLDLEASSNQSATITDGSQTGLDITTNFSIEAWVKVESQPATDTNVQIASKWGSANADKSYTFYYRDEAGTKRLYVAFQNGSGVQSQFYINQTLTVGTWYHIAVTVDIGAPSAKFYVNGTEAVGTADGTSATSVASGAGSFATGKLGSMDTQFWDGLIDDVRVWDRIRTATEISSNKDSELTGTEGNLRGYWKLNNNFEDGTSNNNDLTNNGSAVFSTDKAF